MNGWPFCGIIFAEEFFVQPRRFVSNTGTWFDLNFKKFLDMLENGIIK